jgi:ABC-type phosphate transport system substrate-binding protein
MFKTLPKRPTLIAVVVSLLGVSAMTIGMTVPAGAASSPAQNSIIIGGGSNTTYSMMTQLSALFSSVPGCNPLIVGSTAANQQVNYSCSSTPQPGEENGYPLTSSFPVSPNPYNDVAIEEPALGSGNGIDELVDGGTSPPAGILAAPLSYARSSRAPKATDLGLEFVGYAADTVPWFHFTKYAGAKTPSAKIKSLTTAQLEDIYNGTDTNWNQVGGKAGPIDCYMAQSGSGTESTWAGDLGLTATPGCLSDSGQEQTTGGAATHVIFENEDSSIFPNGDGADAIFFFSYGKYTLLCPKNVCAGTPSADQHNTLAALGEINDVPINQTNILNGSILTDRTLYNVYENGSSQNSQSVPVATQNTLNLISSAGFLCNDATQAYVDPLSPTGQTYGQEIDAIISDNGFLPLPSAGEGDGSVTGTVNPVTSSPTSSEAQITNNTVTYAGASVTNPFYSADATPSSAPDNNGDLGTCRVSEGS